MNFCVRNPSNNRSLTLHGAVVWQRRQPQARALAIPMIIKELETMKKLMFAAAATALFSTAAFAQDSRPAPRDGMSPPSYTQGSGQRAGGPANELNPSTGVAPAAPMGAPATTGTVVVPDGNARQAPTQSSPAVPSYQQGSGQQSGGPAKELNRQ
jgi:hypothetical protein